MEREREREKEGNVEKERAKGGAGIRFVQEKFNETNLKGVERDIKKNNPFFKIVCPGPTLNCIHFRFSKKTLNFVEMW